MPRHEYIARAAAKAAGYLWCNPIPRGTKPYIQNCVLLSGPISLDPEFRADVISVFTTVLTEREARQFGNFTTTQRRQMMDRVLQHCRDLESTDI